MEAAAPVTSPYLSAATAIGADLAQRAQANAAGPSWVGDAVFGETEADARIVRGEVGADLYGGTAGVGWFLAHLAAATADQGLAELARDTLRGAVSYAGQVPATLGAGLYSGQAGVALALLEGGEALADAGLQRLGAELAQRLARTVLDDGPPGAHDLIEGSAGLLIALLRAQRSSADADLEPACHHLALALQAEVQALRWTDVAPPSLCGLGHGASGLAWALAEAAWALDAPPFRLAAGQAMDYERGWYSAERRAWADLRGAGPEAADIAPGWTCAWCHGALGIGAMRARLWEVEADVGALGEATAALQAARALVVQAALSARDGDIPDVTLCHGLGGAVELILLAYEITGDADHLRAARRIGDLCLQVFQHAGGHWSNGARGADYVPGLFLGQAGVGALMLRLHDPGLLGSPALAGRRRFRN